MKEINKKDGQRAQQHEYKLKSGNVVTVWATEYEDYLCIKLNHSIESDKHKHIIFDDGKVTMQ